MNSIGLVCISCVLALSPRLSAASDAGQRIEAVQFAKGSHSVVLKGSVTGQEYVDYRLWAGAGQRMKVAMEGTNLANQFNLLPPGSADVAMFMSSDQTVFEGLLPDDGTYTLRVYLVRSAARRDERSDYQLQVRIDGTPLKPLPASEDALVPGTRYHAQSEVPCKPPYADSEVCAVGVVRREQGAATVDITWSNGGHRRLLFISGDLKAADVPWAWKVVSGDDSTFGVEFDDGARFSLFEELLSGG